jgi:hypothetical protein
MPSSVESSAEGEITVPTTDLLPALAAIAFIAMLICLAVGLDMMAKKRKSKFKV